MRNLKEEVNSAISELEKAKSSLTLLNDDELCELHSASVKALEDDNRLPWRISKSISDLIRGIEWEWDKRLFNNHRSLHNLMGVIEKLEFTSTDKEEEL